MGNYGEDPDNGKLHEPHGPFSQYGLLNIPEQTKTTLTRDGALQLVNSLPIDDMPNGKAILVGAGIQVLPSGIYTYLPYLLHNPLQAKGIQLFVCDESSGFKKALNTGIDNPGFKCEDTLSITQHFLKPRELSLLILHDFFEYPVPTRDGFTNIFKEMPRNAVIVLDSINPSYIRPTQQGVSEEEIQLGIAHNESLQQLIDNRSLVLVNTIDSIEGGAQTYKKYSIFRVQD